MAWTYILECADGSYYVGSTVDHQGRVWQHENGEGAVYTRNRRPVTLVWSAQFDRIDQAFWFGSATACSHSRASHQPKSSPCACR